MIGFPQLAAAQITLFFLSLIWLLRRNDEVPLLISGVLFYCASYRFWAVAHGYGDWVSVWLSLRPITEERALVVLGYIVLGQAILLLTYMYRQKQVLKMSDAQESPDLLNWLRPRVIALSLLGIPLVLSLRYLGQLVLRTNPSALETSSYLLLFPLALVGISVLNISLWKAGGYSSLSNKVIAAGILIYVAYLTFSPNLRFQFFGWIAGAAVIVSANYPRKKRILALVIATVIGVTAFAFAGSLREGGLTQQIGAERPVEYLFTSAADANMLDGFVMLEEVYPDMLDYTWGTDHLEILLRPIPRSIWPDKPVGGYANRLGLNDYETGITGISPSLFGSFYAEGGIVGIVILSIIYGTGLAAIMSYTMRLRPFASLIVRAVVCASLVPMLRGGDLAGGYAWVGMAYWPCFLLLWLKRRSLRADLLPVAVRKSRVASPPYVYTVFLQKVHLRKHLRS